MRAHAAAAPEHERGAAPLSPAAARARRAPERRTSTVHRQQRNAKAKLDAFSSIKRLNTPLPHKPNRRRMHTQAHGCYGTGAAARAAPPLANQTRYSHTVQRPQNVWAGVGMLRSTAATSSRGASPRHGQHAGVPGALGLLLEAMVLHADSTACLVTELPSNGGAKGAPACGTRTAPSHRGSWSGQRRSHSARGAPAHRRAAVAARCCCDKRPAPH